MLFRGLMVTSLSGSMDGVVASHNAGGPYFRNRTTPTDPATARQVNCREAMAACYTWWKDNLSQADREQWHAYAKTTRHTNRIGQQIFLSGWDAFTQMAFLKFQVNEQLGAGTDPGATPPHSHIPFSVAPRAELNDADVIRLIWESDSIWEGDQDNMLVLYVSSIRSGTINFFKGPYQLLAAVIGDSDDPPTSPVDFDLPAPLLAGQRIFYRIRFVGSDKGLSIPYTGMLQWNP